MEAQTLIWTRSPPNPAVARHNHSGAVAGDRYVIFGGLNGDGQALNDVQIFNLASNTWEEPPTINGEAPTPRFGHKSVFLPESNEVLIFGGLLQDNQLYSFSLASYTWSKVPTQGTSPVPRMYI